MPYNNVTFQEIAGIIIESFINFCTFSENRENRSRVRRILYDTKNSQL